MSKSRLLVTVFTSAMTLNPLQAFAVDKYWVPIPASVWLFGSGLLGLVGMARHKS